MSILNGTHKIGRVLVSPALLQDVLLLPCGDEITDVRWNFDKQCVEFMMKSDSFDEISLSEKIPNYNGKYGTIRNRGFVSVWDNYFKGWERVQ